MNYITSTAPRASIGYRDAVNALDTLNSYLHEDSTWVNGLADPFQTLADAVTMQSTASDRYESALYALMTLNCYLHEAGRWNKGVSAAYQALDKAVRERARRDGIAWLN